MRVGLLEGQGFVVNPTVEQMEASSLDLLLAGSSSAVLMIEGFADFLPEDQLLEVSVPALLYQSRIVLVTCCSEAAEAIIKGFADVLLEDQLGEVRPTPARAWLRRQARV